MGIQLPVLPTIVLGGLPGEPDWTDRLVRIGVDVVSSGADPDTNASLALVKERAPYRPIKACGAQAALTAGAWLVEGAPAGDPAGIDDDHVLVAMDGLQFDNPNDVAAVVLEVARDNPARWWVAGRGLADVDAQDAEAALGVLVEGTKLVRLFLTKQQFEQ